MLDNAAMVVIERILAKGNDVIIKHKKDGIVILEDKKEVRYSVSK